jgi:hypothetical protein
MSYKVKVKLGIRVGPKVRNLELELELKGGIES